MKVKIMQRSVYHKYAEVEIDVDEKKLKEYTDVGASITDYIFDNENLFCDELASYVVSIVETRIFDF